MFSSRTKVRDHWEGSSKGANGDIRGGDSAKLSLFALKHPIPLVEVSTQINDACDLVSKGYLRLRVTHYPWGSEWAIVPRPRVQALLRGPDYAQEGDQIDADVQNCSPSYVRTHPTILIEQYQTVPAKTRTRPNIAR